MRYAITGGAGFIGSHLAEELCKSHEILLIDNLLSGKKGNIQHLLTNKSVQFIQGTVSDYSSLKSYFQDIDGIFHEAAITSVPRSIQDPRATNEVNVTGTINVLTAALECDVKKIVFASSSIYGDTPTLPKREDMPPKPLSPYAISKWAGELYLQNFSKLYGLKGISLRYFNVFGPRQDPTSEYAAVIPKFILCALNNKPITIYGDGRQTRDFTYVKDVVQANIKAMENNVEGVFNIAYGQQHSILDLARRVMDLVHQEVPITYEKPRPGDIQDSLADISLAMKKFNYKPEYLFNSGLQETIQWFRSH